MNDQEAIVLLKSDSHEAFEYLYKVYGGQVYNFSKLYINSSEDIKEVVQEVFVKLWEARSFLREDENFYLSSPGILSLTARKKHLMKTSINCLF